MIFLRSLIFCIRVKYIFAREARRVRRGTYSLGDDVRNEVMYDMLQELYAELLEEATLLTMKGEEDIYYNILDTAYDSAVKRYLKRYSKPNRRRYTRK